MADGLRELFESNSIIPWMKYQVCADHPTAADQQQASP